MSILIEHTCATENGCKACAAMVARWQKAEDERTDAALQKAFNDGRRSGWDAACSAVADAVSVGSMTPPRATRQEAEDVAHVVVRVRGLIEDVERRGAPQQERLEG